MTFDIKLAGLYVLALIIMAGLIALPHRDKTEVAYDCRIAEISPDVPPKVKEECRKLQGTKHD